MPIIHADDDNDADDGVCFGAEFSPTIEGCSSWYDWDYHNSDHRDQIVDQNNEHRDNSSCDDHPDHHDNSGHHCNLDISIISISTVFWLSYCKKTFENNKIIVFLLSCYQTYAIPHCFDKNMIP